MLVYVRCHYARNIIDNNKLMQPIEFSKNRNY